MNPGRFPKFPPGRNFKFGGIGLRPIPKDGAWCMVCGPARNNPIAKCLRRSGAFVAEYIYDKETLSSGSVGNVAFWPDEEQSIMAINDPGNFRARFVERSSGEVLGYFGHFGTYGGEFDRNHQIEFDSSGNLYVSEDFRVQKFNVSNGAVGQ